jgi:hypothetical protein
VGPVIYDFIVPVHKLAILNWYSAPPQVNLLINVKLVQGMTTNQLEVTALCLMTFCKADGTIKVVSPDRKLLLPEFSSRESLSVQLETVRLNGVTAMGMIENLVSVVST